MASKIMAAEIALFYNVSIKVKVFGIVNLYVNKATHGSVVYAGINQYLVINLGRIELGTANKVTAILFIYQHLESLRYLFLVLIK